jgi:MoaA/NifB/PqqE/SkfB family radical SAM enzyme
MPSACVPASAEERVTRLLEARLDLDTRCNFRCLYCRNFDEAGAARGPVALDLLERAGRYLSPHCWSVYLSCAGEPLLHPAFAQTLAVTDRVFARCDASLVTNGWHLHPPAAQAIACSRLSTVYVSIDTVDPALYSRLCGTPTDGLERVQRNVLELRRLIGSRSFPKVVVTSIAMRSTLQGLPAVTDWAARSRLCGHKVQLLIPGSMPGHDEELSPDGLTERVLADAAGVARSRGLHFDYPYGFTTVKLLSALSALRLVRHRLEYVASAAARALASRRRGCRFMPFELNMLGDGRITVCPYRADTLWDIAREGALEHRELARRMRAAVRADAPTCASCRFMVR